MTFEEVYKILYKKYDIVRFDYSDNTIKAKSYITIDTFDLFELINGLKETYAPKIEMTKKQKQAIEVDLLGLFDIDSDTDWDTGFIDEDSLGVVVISELSGLAEDDVVRAWLHPELIEVAE